MSTEGKEMSPNEGNLMEMFDEIELRKNKYENLSKDSLLDRLVMTEMLLSELKNPDKNIELWYYVSSNDECKYLTDEKPKVYFSASQETLYSDGEINIRVPKCMERMFPDIKYGDEPIRVTLGTWLI